MAKKLPKHIYKTFKTEIGWGYDIIQIGKGVIIHQPHKPAVSGLQGFLTQIEAEKIAKLVSDRLDRGLNPQISAKICE